MGMKTFLRDQLPFIGVYLFNVCVVVLVIELALLQANQSLGKENIVYLFVLSLFFLVVFLIASFIRRLPFYREVSRGNRKFGDVLNVESAVTYEQRALQDVLHDNYRSYVEELEAYEEAVDRHHHFTNQWVHGMKTPVSVINLLIQQGREAESLEETKKLFQSIGEENERIEHGLEMILHMARLEKFELDVAPHRVELLELVRDVINEQKKAMIRYAIYPKVESDEDEVFVETDQKWLHFVVRQLITNAIKYSRKGEGKTITVTIKKMSSGASLTVTDEGIGIPEQDVPRVFNPFFTGENGRKTSESTGMGLYLVKEVCGRLGHQIRIKSEEGTGTMVRIDFLDSPTLYRELAGGKR
jgi:signal transduction histidine kinase